MKAVIMAGGKGTRLRPLTCDCPKPMVPIMNKPVMEHIINLLKRHGITEIAVTTFYLPEVIEDYFGDGSEFGVNLHYYVEESPLGTAGSVKNAEEFLDEPFIVISGDAMTDIDLTAAYEYHQEQGSAATLVLTQEDIPLEYGVVMTNEQGEITQFLEKPNWGEVFSDTVNTGIYILDPYVFNYYDSGVKFDFSQDLFPQMLANDEPMYGYVSDAYWCDVGNLQQYRQTHYDIIAQRVEVEIPGQQIEEQVWVGEGTEIEEGVELSGPLYIGQNCTIKSGSRLAESIIGDNNLIKGDTSIKRSILWNNIFLDYKSELRGTVICNGVNIKDHTSIFEGSAIGQGTKVGSKVKVKPRVKVWPYKELDDTTILNKSLVWETHWSRTLFGNQGVVGISNIEVTPEFAAKLATAYGATLDAETVIAVSADSYAMSKMIKQALQAGLLSAGIEVMDIGELFSPVARYGVGNLEVAGGLHVRACQIEPQNTVIEFLDQSGINISRQQEKGIEKIFFREDFQRADVDAISSVESGPQILDAYLEELFTTVDVESISQANYRLVADYEEATLAEIFSRLASELNCELLEIDYQNQGARPLSLQQRLAREDQLLDLSSQEDVDLGVVLGHNLEELTLITDQGEIVAQEINQILRAIINLERGAQQLFLPVTAPRVIENIAQEYGADIEWTKVEQKSQLKNILTAEEAEAVTDDLPVVGDALVFLVKLLEFLAQEELKLSQLLASIPEFYRVEEEVECAWEVKGKVMRNLIEQTPEEKIELIDGIKVNQEESWALVLPDSERPVFSVYAEADSFEAASDLSAEYAELIRDLQT
ncbi:sugar phosphate nucleotidyltransferase [Fuchsiella alkaliacetigena]|uniref:sugar phosphate nucleotidyltransferase n=1 Tax=Fuchsiella alkaliacetigena TaxID=957042 RepID=UPI00200A2BF2|nr:sugar phosphate nucleotidyltransferase [Fuchsiella alkaliacetigena]MCK8824854.1 sugar phosphate nucleotidyltransferase [Fuchsiella alkaliacetigena]